LNRIKIVGLTGQSGAGKSTVSAYFAKNGMCVINADEIVKNLYTPDSVCLKAVSGVFGLNSLFVFTVGQNDFLNRLDFLHNFLIFLGIARY
jgi:ABC-type thiamine transport system ATPase subunit